MLHIQGKRCGQYISLGSQTGVMDVCFSQKYFADHHKFGAAHRPAKFPLVGEADPRCEVFEVEHWFTDRGGEKTLQYFKEEGVNFERRRPPLANTVGVYARGSSEGGQEECQIRALSHSEGPRMACQSCGRRFCVMHQETHSCSSGETGGHKDHACNALATSHAPGSRRLCESCGLYFCSFHRSSHGCDTHSEYNLAEHKRGGHSDEAEGDED